MIINSGVTNIARVLPFEVGNEYKKYDVVYYSGYTDPSPTPPTLHPCSQAESGHCYYTGAAATSTLTNRPYAGDTEWTTGFFADVSYGATVNYETLNYTTEFGDGYYNVLNKSENAVRASFSTSFDKRTDQETKAIVHILEDSFNRGNHPSGGYSGIPWTPFPPYNQSGEFFVESFTQGYESPDVNSVSTTFFRETASTTDWKALYIPFEDTRMGYADSIRGDVTTNYFQHDATFLRTLADQEDLLPAETGWYYFTGEKHADYTPETGILGTIYNSPTGQHPLWTKDNFYFDLNQNISIPQNPRFTKQNLDNGFVMRFNEGINKNLLAFPVDLKGRTDKEALAIVHFLEHHGGVRLFQFTPPAPYDFTNKVFLAANWSHTIIFKDNNDITVNMREFPIDYLNLSDEFKSLVTVVNRPLKNLPAYWSWPTEGMVTGPYSPGPVSINRYAGSKSTKERIENTDFISNTGMKVFTVTGQSIRTGFYLTNSGNVSLHTSIDYDDPYQVFDFPSGHPSSPVITLAGRSSFIPFYFKGFADNVTASGPDVGTTGPEVSGVYSATLTLNSFNFDGARDTDGPITVGITGYITGFDAPANLPDTRNPYRGNDGQTPNHPARFLIQTGYYDVSGVPLHLLSWEHPATGHNLNRYSIQYTQDNSWGEVSGIPLTDDTSVRNIQGVRGTGFEINRKYIQSYASEIMNTAGYVQTDLYTGILVPSSLAGAPEIPQGQKNFPDPQNTGIHQEPYFLHRGMTPGQDYYYRMRSEYVQNNNIVTSAIEGSMYVYASGVPSLVKEVSNQVSTGLGSTSTEFSNTRTAIPTTNKPPFKVFLPDQSTNINLSGEFIKGLVGAGIVNQENGLDMVVMPQNPTIANYLEVANTGAYGDNFTGVQFILKENAKVGGQGGAIGNNSFYQTTTPPEDIDVTMVTPAIRTGFQLLTGVVNVDDAGVGADTNLQKPIAETPTVLIMQQNSAVIGQGGVGGSGGYTKLAQTSSSKEGHHHGEGHAIFSKGAADQFTLTVETESLAESTDGHAGGDAIYISDPSIDKFSIRKDYNAKIFAGGGGGGGGDRFKVEKMSSLATATGQGGKKARNKNIKAKATTGAGLLGAEWTASVYTEIIHDNKNGNQGQLRVRTAGAPPSTYSAWNSSNTDMGGSGLLGGGNFISWNPAGGGLASFMGTHKGGAGGGGAGFGVSQGGRQIGLTPDQTVMHAASMGGYKLRGKGNFSGGVDIKKSYGGDGGNYGERGSSGESFTKEGMQMPFLLTDKTGGHVGGLAGKAIRAISTNINYTASNYRDKLLAITPSITPITDISGLVGYFEAGNKSYNTGTTEALDNETVEKWVSINDPNVYLSQTTTNNKPKLKDSQEDDETVGTGTALNRSKSVTIKPEFFNNQKYIYFTPTTDAKIQYMFLHGASANAASQGDVQIDNTGTPYVAAVAVTISIHPIDFSISAGTVIRFRGGSDFRLTSGVTYSAPNRITELVGELSGGPLINNTVGYYRLSSLMEGFDIFYVMYPNKWFKDTGDFTANAGAVGVNDKDADFQTGWVDFSLPTLTENECYSRKDYKITDNTGLGMAGKTFSFADRGYPSAVGGNPDRAWVYNLSGETLAGELRLTARNSGNVVEENTYRGSSFTFNSSGSVLIGGNRGKGTSTVDFGFRGGIAAMIIFNRKLTGVERRKVLGVLLNKYMRTNTANLPYSAGTAYQVGATVTGVGTSWTAAMVGRTFSFNGITSSGLITAWSSNTSIEVTEHKNAGTASARLGYLITDEAPFNKPSDLTGLAGQIIIKQ